MSSLVVGIVVVVFLLAIWNLRAWQPGSKNRRREDFESFIRALLLLMENGSRLHVEERGSAVSIDFIRADGATDEALVVLRVPRFPWSERCVGALAQILETNELDGTIDAEPDSAVLAEVRIPVGNIWEERSGAECARAAHLLLDGLSVPKDARFDLTQIGRGSMRVRKRVKRIRKGEDLPLF